jgi:unsaturated pyranuronate lyase
MKKTKSKNSKKGVAPPALNYINWGQLELEEVNPLFRRQFVVGQNVMLSRILLKQGCIVPLHSHHNEQISFVLEGALKFWIDDREIVVRGGEVLAIPPHMPHKVEALLDSTTMDIFSPPRADWIRKTDQYLRDAPAKATKSPRTVGR